MTNTDALNGLLKDNTYRKLLENVGVLPAVEQLCNKHSTEDSKDVRSKYELLGYLVVLVDNLKSSITDNNTTDLANCTTNIVSIATELFVKFGTEDVMK